MTPHVHAEVIKAWADGAEIQWRQNKSQAWQDCGVAPNWSVNTMYRVRPPQSDLERYGVQVGDVWVVEKGAVRVARSVSADTVTDIYGFNLEKHRFTNLLFRRGLRDFP
jgi:hypothetical protein